MRSAISFPIPSTFRVLQRKTVTTIEPLTITPPTYKVHLFFLELIMILLLQQMEISPPSTAQTTCKAPEENRKEKVAAERATKNLGVILEAQGHLYRIT